MATRYWVGGTGTWDASSTANWSVASGGASGASAPVAADTVIFDSLSGTGTCTTASGSACATATLNSSTLTLKLGANHTMSGQFSLVLGNIDINSNVLTCSIFNFNNTNVRSIAFGTGKIVLTGNAAFIWRADDLVNFSLTGTPTVESNYSGATGTRTFVNGLSNGSETTAINLKVTAGSDTISPYIYLKNIDLTGFSGVVTNNARTIYGDLTVSSTCTLNGGSLVQTFASTSGVKTITTAGKTFDFNMTFNGIGGTWAFQDALTQGFRAFTITNGTVQLKAGVTSTVGSFATSGTGTKTLSSTSSGSQATLSQASGKVNATYLTVKDIATSGNATWFGTTNTVTQGNNTGWCFTPQLGKPMPSFAF